MNHDYDGHLGARVQPTQPRAAGHRTIRIDLPSDSLPRRNLWTQQADRILKFQRQWERIKTDLPPQLSRKQSECIPIVVA